MIQSKEELSQSKQETNLSQLNNSENETIIDFQQEIHINDSSPIQSQSDNLIDYNQEYFTLRHRTGISRNEIPEILKLPKDELEIKIYKLYDESEIIIHDHINLKDDFKIMKNDFINLNEHCKNLEDQIKKLKSGNLIEKNKKFYISKFCSFLIITSDSIIDKICSLIQLNFKHSSIWDFEIRFNLIAIIPLISKILKAVWDAFHIE